jgi:hypothetical protein
VNDEALFERRHGFLTQRIAGGTFRSIAERYNAKSIEAVTQAGRPVDEADTVSAATVRKDVERAKAELIDNATRDALRGEHRAILLDLRRANYKAMAGGDVDAAKVVMSTLVREAEMFGLDEPKRTQIGVGTDVEFASDLIGLIHAVVPGAEIPPELAFLAREDPLAIDRVPAGDTGVLDAEVIPLDLTAPDPRPVVVEDSAARAAAEGAPWGTDPADDDPWSNV